jgi:iron complex outermembrane receptor protein
MSTNCYFDAHQPETGKRMYGATRSGLFRIGLFLALAMTPWLVTLAQVRVTGKVTSAEYGEPMPGVAVIVKGTTTGVNTDDNGMFSLNVPDQNAVLVFRSFGYLLQEIVVGSQTEINVSLESDVQTLGEVVLIGYGTQKKSDLTGSIASITSKDFIQGNIATPEQLIAGKVAGVQITSNGGAPGSGATIRIRGGSSLNANNDPLIVIDGVPVESAGIAGSANALSFINPNDIESFSILKDASATAIYGSRASNGVIIITTKKGRAGDKFSVGFNTVQSVASGTRFVDVLSAEEFTQVVNERGNAGAKALLGTANTDWQQEIFRTAISSDNNLSFTGAIKEMPYRASIGYLNQNGILLGSNMDRTSASIGLSPKLFDDHLRIDVNLKGIMIGNKFADQGAIGAAVNFDPTQPVYSNSDKFGGFFEWTDVSGNPNTLATRNPVSLLENRDDVSTVFRSIGNIQFDYRFHFLPELRANLNMGYDVSSSEGSIFIPADVASSFARGGVDAVYTQSKVNQVLDFYLNYVKELGSAQKIDLMAGYSYQDFVREDSSLDKNVAGTVFTSNYYKSQYTLVSFYGRLNYTLLDRYVITATLRQDGSSKFGPDNRWGLFPSAALAWKVMEEPFMSGINDVVSDLKVRLGYGVTGQQDVFGDYPYLARYSPSFENAMYQFGNTFYRTLRPEGYDANIKWEQTETYNAGIDFGFGDDRITGSIDYYFKRTEDLLAVIPVPAGSNLTNQILTNVGNIENKGIEFLINWNAVRKNDLNVNVGFNLTYNENTITNLTKVEDPTFPGILVGGIGGGVGNTIQIHTVNYPTNAFFVYRQVYDETGKPIEGLYEDTNGDGRSTPDDRYRYQSPNPQYFLGFNGSMTYKDFSFSFVARSNIGNYMYNNVNSERGTYRSIANSNNFLTNMVPDVLATDFANNQYFSDYYIENASFLRLDNVTLGYNFSEMFNNKFRLQATLIGQNLALITKYTGIDPEIAGGIDNNFYPRPRTISLGLNVNL